MLLSQVPNAVALLFISIVIFSLYWIYQRFKVSKIALLVIFIWLALQGILAFKGFYLVNTTIPPRFILMVLPPLLFFLILFNTQQGKKFIDQIAIEKLTLIHIIRIPVELVLFALFTSKTIPQLMTFEGANFDILSGISAPLIYFFVLKKSNSNKYALLLWNVLCLILLLIIVGIAILSAPFPFQQFGFEQPNIGVLYFPFNWLPSFIVPLVLFAHLAAIRKIVLTDKNK